MGRLLGSAAQAPVPARSGHELALDRHVQLFGEEGRGAVRRLSEIRSHRHIVLLGEPGMGKSTVFAAEAKMEGLRPIMARALMNGVAPDDGPALFIDGLDEYRTDGSAEDKVNKLAAAIIALAPERWRLACRAEDWRKNADMQALVAAADGEILVAQMLPLDEAEQLEVLGKIGVADPDAFLAEARRHHAEPLLENPLSLKLLHKAVSAEADWPDGRFALYDAATKRLAFEHNDLRQDVRDRTPVPSILAAAERANFLLLAGGARAIWRSAGPLPGGEDARAFVDSAIVNDAPRVIGHMLDTPLFTAVGDAFEPMHRTIAEFLGARSLAEAVVGTRGPALPLIRATALITALDGRAPTELRGLYAWFAAHLAKLGATDQARELAENDPVSVLIYGDAAVFDLETKRAMLVHLDRHDPYFLGFDVGATTLGALATEDLVPELIDTLEKPASTHRLSIVFEILRAGPRLNAVQPVLRDMILDPTREGWQRARALPIWLDKEGGSDALRRELFDALGTEPVSVDRETLRALLLLEVGDGDLADADIFAVLQGYTTSAGTSTIGSLYALERRLSNPPRASLFEVPRSQWDPGHKEPRSSGETERLLDTVLAAAIARTPDLDAARLWRWMKNTSDDEIVELDRKSAKAVVDWVDADAARELALFEAILDDPKSGPNPHIEFGLTVRLPSATLVRQLMALASREPDAMRRDRLIRSVVESTRGSLRLADIFAEVHDWIAASGRDADLERLVSSDLADRPRRISRNREVDADAQRVGWQTNYASRIAGIRSGADEEALYELVHEYFAVGVDDEQSDRRSRFADRVGKELADAALSGYRVAALKAPWPAHELGAASGEGQTLLLSAAALVGVDDLLKHDPAKLAGASPDLALAVFSVTGSVTDGERRREIEGWAVSILDRDPALGAKALVAMWEGLLSVDPEDASALWVWANGLRSETAVPLALGTFLRAHPDLAFAPLRILLMAAAKLPAATLEALARAALSNAALPGPAKTLWSVLLFALAGDSERGLLAGHPPGQLEMLLEGSIGDTLLGLIPVADAAKGAARAAAIVRILGAKSQPHDSQPSGGRVMRAYRKSDAVHAALNAMAGNPDPAVGQLLDECLSDPLLVAWQDKLRHAREQHKRLWRDVYHAPPTPEAISLALAGTDPANAADLRAVVVDEAERLGRKMHNDADSAWRHFWNTDSSGRAVSPKIENAGRDLSLTLLSERLLKYRIMTLPEAQHVNETRADLLILSGSGRTLPVEAKRHWHPDLWEAAQGQLQGYATAATADGNGILLVLWFGADVAATPPRADKKKPSTAAELKTLLVSDLPGALRDRTDVIVLDVSAPPGKRAPKAIASGSKPPSAATATERARPKAPVKKAAPTKKT